MNLGPMSVSSKCDVTVPLTKSDQVPIIILFELRVKEAVRLAVYIREEVIG
jgi:hypothetical protein